MLAMGSSLLARDPAPGWARVVSSLVKIRPGQIPTGSTTANLAAARGECQGFQISVPPPAEKVRASASPLSGPGKAIELRLYREEWIDVRTPSNIEGKSGLWPDPLIPLVDSYANESRRAVPANSESGRPLVFYAEICVPLSQQAGEYRGNVRLTADQKEPVALDINLKVQSFQIPPTSSLSNTFGLSLLSIARGHQLTADGPEARQLLRRYARALLAHRVSAHGLSMQPPRVSIRGGQPLVDFSGYDQEMAGFFEGKELASGAHFTTAEVRESPVALSEEQRSSYYRAFAEHFRQKKWPALLFYYAKDEPRPEDYPLVIRQAQLVHRAGPIPVLVTAPFSETWKGVADILCPNLNCFFPRPGPLTCSAIQSADSLRALLKGIQVWWYQSCTAHGCGQIPPRAEEQQAYSGWASYMVDHPATLNRAMGPLAFLAGVDGELYFDTVFAYNRKDPWEDVYEFGGNGDGTFFYPGIPSRIGGKTHIPIESLRLKHLRDGLEDFEYLRLLKELGDEALARRLVRQLARSGYQIERDPVVWERTREEMAVRLKVLWEKRMANAP